jgi:hypothetical protein
MTMKNKKRGAPPGNQNARKHGFYSRVLDADEQQDLEQAVLTEGLDEEIALLRVKIKSILRHDPQNVNLILQATGMLSRLITARYHISKEDKQGLAQAISNVLKDVALPLGLSIGNFLER